MNPDILSLLANEDILLDRVKSVTRLGIKFSRFTFEKIVVSAKKIDA